MCLCVLMCVCVRACVCVWVCAFSGSYVLLCVFTHRLVSVNGQNSDDSLLYNCTKMYFGRKTYTLFSFQMYEIIAINQTDK